MWLLLWLDFGGWLALDCSPTFQPPRLSIGHLLAPLVPRSMLGTCMSRAPSSEAGNIELTLSLPGSLQVIHMIEENRFHSFFIEPPCATFSPVRPAVRSYKQPLGFDRCHPKSRLFGHWYSCVLGGVAVGHAVVSKAD